MENLKNIVTVIKWVMFGAIAIWQLFQIGGYLDPFKGWRNGIPQVIAAFLVVLTYFLVAMLLRRVPKYRLRWWHGVFVLGFLLVFFFLSLNIVLNLFPAEWFSEPGMTEFRLQLTLVFYSLFAILLGVMIAFINRLRPGA